MIHNFTWQINTSCSTEPYGRKKYISLHQFFNWLMRNKIILLYGFSEEVTNARREEGKDSLKIYLSEVVKLNRNSLHEKMIEDLGRHKSTKFKHFEWVVDKSLRSPFFSIWVFYHEHSQFAGQQGKELDYLFNSSLPLPSISQALRLQLDSYCKEVTSARSQQPVSQLQPETYGFQTQVANS